MDEIKMMFRPYSHEYREEVIQKADYFICFYCLEEFPCTDVREGRGLTYDQEAEVKTKAQNPLQEAAIYYPWYIGFDSTGS